MRIILQHVLLLVLSCVILAGCGHDDDRRIRLASGSGTSTIRERVTTTIQVAANKSKSVAILHFINESQNPELAWLEQGIVEMLVTDLGQSRQLSVVPSDRVLEAFSHLGVNRREASTPPGAAKLAKYLHAEVIVCGRYLQDHDSLNIELDLIDGRTGQSMEAMRVSGAGLGQVFTMVDQLNRNLRQSLQISIKGDSEQATATAEYPTRSLDAYKHYIKGVELVDKFYHSQAKTHLQKAVELDSTFTSAFIELVHLNMAVGDMEQARKLLQKSPMMRQTATAKELLEIKCLDALVSGDIYKTVEMYRKIIELNPKDDNAHYNLANYLRPIFRHQEAAEHLETAVALNPQNKMAWNTLGYVYADMGQLEYALDALNQYIELAKDEPNPYDSMADLYLGEGQLDKAIEYYKRALDINSDFFPSITKLANCYLLRGEIDNATQLKNAAFAKATGVKDSLNAYILQANCHIFKGELEKVLPLLQRILAKHRTHRLLKVAYSLDPNSETTRSHFEAYFKTQLSQTPEKFSYLRGFFNVVDLSLSTGFYEQETEALLEKLVQSDSIAAPYHTVLIAYRQIYEMKKKQISLQKIVGLGETLNRQSLEIAQPIPWSHYWQHFYRAVENFYNQPNATDFFEIYSTEISLIEEPMIRYSLWPLRSHYQRLLGHHEEADALRAEAGMPYDHHWRISPAFTFTAGIVEKFEPETLSLKHLKRLADSHWMMAEDGLEDGYVDLVSLIDTPELNHTVYAFLPIHSPKARNVHIRIGSNRFISVWLNQEPILKKYNREYAYMDQDIVSARLKAGFNGILVKMSNPLAVMGFYFRLTDENGYGFTDLSYGSPSSLYAVQPSLQR